MPFSARTALFLSLWVTCSSSTGGLPEEAALSHLNSLRVSAGMIELNENTQLGTAADNHSYYQMTNSVIGHYETPGALGFTGVTPSDRTTYAGFLSTFISENVSYGQQTAESSIDSLMSAIYHRFNFLRNDIDSIGIGIRSEYYTYDFGNSGLNALCGGASYNGNGSYYTGVCANASLKIEASAFDSARTSIATSNPVITMWPAANSRDIPPAFFEESPDPLPAYGVSGYPVSVEFNEMLVSGTISVDAFSLFDDTNAEVSYAHKVLMPSDDVNAKFTAKQFAIFPHARLHWGKTYRAQLAYRIDGEAQQIETWSFTTRGLPHRYYVVDGQNSAAFDVVSNEPYSIYFVPRDQNDTSNSYSYGYQGGMTVDAEFVDGNTINATVTGTIGQQASFTLSNGQQLTLTVASTDSAFDNAIVFDTDTDGIDDNIDNCPDTSNRDQEDTDTDGQGNACDPDDDNDGINDGADDFPLDPAEQLDTDGDRIGNNADSDDDNDTVVDLADNCPLVVNPGQIDGDGDGVGDACDIDSSKNDGWWHKKRRIRFQ